MDDDRKPKFQKLVHGIRTFFRMILDGEFADVFIRVAIFCALVVVVHAVLIWIIHNVVIPFLKMWFYDQVLDEAMKRIEHTEWNGWSVAKISQQLEF